MYNIYVYIYFRKRATSASAEGPAYGLDFERRCEFPLRALQAQKWRVYGSCTFYSILLLYDQTCVPHYLLLLLSTIVTTCEEYIYIYIYILSFHFGAA